MPSGSLRRHRRSRKMPDSLPTPKAIQPPHPQNYRLRMGGRLGHQRTPLWRTPWLSASRRWATGAGKVPIQPASRPERSGSVRRDPEPPAQSDLTAAARQPSAMLGWSPFDAMGGGWEGLGGFEVSRSPANKESHPEGWLDSVLDRLERLYEARRRQAMGEQADGTADQQDHARRFRARQTSPQPTSRMYVL